MRKKEEKNKVIGQKRIERFLYNICARFCTDMYCGLDFRFQLHRAVVRISAI